MNSLLVKQLALSLTIASGIPCVLKVIRKCSIVISDVATSAVQISRKHTFLSSDGNHKYSTILVQLCVYGLPLFFCDQYIIEIYQNVWHPLE